MCGGLCVTSSHISRQFGLTSGLGTDDLPSVRLPLPMRASWCHLRNQTIQIPRSDFAHVVGLICSYRLHAFLFGKHKSGETIDNYDKRAGAEHDKDDQSPFWDTANVTVSALGQEVYCFEKHGWCHRALVWKRRGNKSLGWCSESTQQHRVRGCLSWRALEDAKMAMEVQ
jgi:hypothetical protein